MKLRSFYSFFIVLLFLGSCKDASGQDASDESENVPEAVRTSFQRQYPGEDDPDWHLDSNGYWESHFKIDGTKHRADYKEDGTWVETEISIDEDELPEAVLKVIEDKYAEENITEVEKVSSGTIGEFYDVEFKRKGKNKDVMFRASGEIIKE